MKLLAAILLLALPVQAAKPPGIKKADRVPVVRLLYPSGKEYGCAVPVGDKLVTASHANTRAGIRIRCTYKDIQVTRTIIRSTRVLVPRISTGEGDQNRSGDLAVCELDSPLPYWIQRQALATRSPFGSPVTGITRSGTKVKMVVLPLDQRTAAIPDGRNPRWLIFQRPPADTTGNSGSAVVGKGGLVSIFSRANAGPNLCHPDVQSVLVPALR